MSYNYQNLESINLKDSVPVNNTNVMFDKCNYQTTPPTYQCVDPRLNYAYYNALQTSYNYPSNEYVYSAPQMYDLSLPKEAPNIPVKTDEELWIETWLSKIGKIQINLNSTIEITTSDKLSIKKSTNNIQIHTAKSVLKNCLSLLDKLQATHEFLKSNANVMSSEDWKRKTSEIGPLKEEFSKMMSIFDNSDVLKNLQKNVECRRKKRECQKRKRKLNALNKSTIEEERKMKEKQIDTWLQSMVEEVEKAKSAENMKKDADCILAEVTKKKVDARKSLTLIASLIKLRRVREHAALQRGDKISLEDHNAFETVSEHLVEIWSNALHVYGKEEQGLKLMIEETITKDSNAARAAKEKRITDEWMNTLFGPKCIPNSAFYGLTIADHDFETFVAIRKSWDTFLSKPEDINGSQIPIGWITPNAAPIDNWTKYLNKH